MWEERDAAIGVVFYTVSDEIEDADGLLSLRPPAFGQLCGFLLDRWLGAVNGVRRRQILFHCGHEIPLKTIGHKMNPCIF